ncbi:MAG: GntR family transcriptional regulator, partial [Pseudomonadota bacterium]
MATLNTDLAKPPGPPPLRERALYEQVAERLRSRILAHTLHPGSWIDEQALAAEFG